MSYYTDVLLNVSRLDEKNVEKIQEYAKENFGGEFKREKVFYKFALVGSFKTFFEREFVRFLASLEWEFDYETCLLCRGEDDYSWTSYQFGK